MGAPAEGESAGRRRTGGRVASGTFEELLPPQMREGFVEVGEAYLDYYRELGGLEPGARMLEIGCGYGRMAIPLTGYLGRDGSYEGLDVWTDAVRWCEQNITPRHPNFRFRIADVFSRMYNPSGGQAPAEYTFPYPDSEFDFVAAVGVFPCMRPRAEERYLSEIARVLRDGGTLLATFLLVNDASLDAVRNGDSVIALAHREGPYWGPPDPPPESPLAHEQEHLRSLCSALGLELRDDVLWGRWSGRETDNRGRQDIVVADRRPRG